MKKLLLIAVIGAALFTGTTISPVVNAAVDGITADNYQEYVKPNADAYGYNKGECDRDYLPGEEQFYSEDYDHWNVDRVYDPELVVTEEETGGAECEPDICPYCGQEMPDEN